MPYTYEQKLEVVRLVNEEHCSYSQAGKRIGVSDTTVLQWVNLVSEHGVEALKDRKHTTYTGEFKLEVINYMHDQQVSTYAAAAHFNIAKTQIQRWERIFYEEGPEALMIERRGRPRNKMPRKRNTDSIKKQNEDLIAEVQRLRMENEYLKKLNALVQGRKERELKRKLKSSEN